MSLPPPLKPDEAKALAQAALAAATCQDGSVRVPEALRPYLGGREFLTPLA